MNWNIFTRKALIWPVLIVAFLACYLCMVLVRFAFNGFSDDISEEALRTWCIISFWCSIGICSVLYPILKKKFIGSKYPLKRESIRPKDLSIGDVITFPDRVCVFEGCYHGYYLFAPKEEFNGEEDYVKLKKEQIHKLVQRVVSPEYGLKWESPLFV